MGEKTGRILVFVLLALGCSEPIDWRAEAAAAVGDQLAQRLAGPLAGVAEAGADAGPDPTEGVLEAALRDLRLPPEISRVVRGSHSSWYVGDGYADVWAPLVLVPNGDTEYMFCMVFALSTRGELVARPAPGNPRDRCDDTDTGRLRPP